MNRQGIASVPSHVRVVDFRQAKKGEYLLTESGGILQAQGETCVKYVVVAPDNYYNAIDLTALALPEGHERLGDSQDEWFREPIGDDEWLGWSGAICKGAPGGMCPTADRRRIILSPIQPKTWFMLVAEIPITKWSADNIDSVAVTMTLKDGGKQNAFASFRVKELPL